MSRDYDLAVIGAGIHGAGVAQAAAAAGHTVLVLEQNAPAAGTSSRSSKLIHGGLRYLETGQFNLVREALAERELLLELAPELVQRVPFHLPVYAGMARPPWMLAAGLALYALLGGLGKAMRFARLPRSKWDTLDGLRTDRLRAVFRYFDAQTDDALLTRAVLGSAQSLGAELVCPARFLGAERDAHGYTVRYLAGNTTHECHVNALVNAAGPWAATLLADVVPAPPRLTVELVQGTHVVVPGRLAAGCYYVESPRDRRAVFLLPWRKGTLIGTTESAFHGDPSQVAPLAAEVDYLRETAEQYFPALDTRIVSAFAGLRVLPAGRNSHFHRPRETLLLDDGGAPARLVTVLGGKLTTYRRTALKVLARLAPALPLRRVIADTAKLRLSVPS